MKNKYIGISISPQIKVLVGIEIEGSDELYSVDVFKDGNWTISDFDCMIADGDKQVFDEGNNLIKLCKYYDIHVFWSRKDGYSVFMKVDNTDYAEEELLDEEALLNIAMGRGLLTPEDANQVDYIKEISEQEYKDWTYAVPRQHKYKRRFIVTNKE